MFTRNPLQYLYNSNNLYDIAMKLNHKELASLPKIKKLVISFSSATLNNNYLEDYLGILQLLTHQKPVIIRSKKIVINMKIKKNQILGFKVTLRGYAMFHFLMKFFALIAPRYPFFQGYNFGYNHGCVSFLYDKLNFFHELEQNPEYSTNVNFPKMHFTLHTTAQSKYEAFNLLRNLQLPCVKLN